MMEKRRKGEKKDIGQNIQNKSIKQWVEENFRGGIGKIKIKKKGMERIIKGQETLHQLLKTHNKLRLMIGGGLLGVVQILLRMRFSVTQRGSN